jgi:hypothetical protein
VVNLIQKAWQQITGEKALDELAKKGLVENLDQ